MFKKNILQEIDPGNTFSQGQTQVPFWDGWWRCVAMCFTADEWSMWQAIYGRFIAAVEQEKGYL